MLNNLQSKGYHIENIGSADPAELVKYLETEFTIKEHPIPDSSKVVNNKVVKVSNFDGLFSNVLMDWHYDSVYTDPEHFVALNCKCTEQSSTAIWSGKEALKALTPEHKQLILDNNNITMNPYANWIGPVPDEDNEVRAVRTKDRSIVLDRKFINHHPVFGTEYLYFPFVFLDNSEITEIILEHYFEPFVYTHHWKEGDLVIMDQFYTMHKREAFTGDRLLYHCAGYYH